MYFEFAYLIKVPSLNKKRAAIIIFDSSFLELSPSATVLGVQFVNCRMFVDVLGGHTNNVNTE